MAGLKCNEAGSIPIVEEYEYSMPMPMAKSESIDNVAGKSERSIRSLNGFPKDADNDSDGSDHAEPNLDQSSPAPEASETSSELSLLLILRRSEWLASILLKSVDMDKGWRNKQSCVYAHRTTKIRPLDKLWHVRLPAHLSDLLTHRYESRRSTMVVRCFPKAKVASSSLAVGSFLDSGNFGVGGLIKC